MLDRATLDHWYLGEVLEGVRYRLNDSVALTSQPNRFASVISLQYVSPEPGYLIEFSSGTDAIVSQSDLATVIYVALLDEGTNVWRPVAAVPLGGSVYRIISQNACPDDEAWQFATGSEVRCEPRTLQGHLELVATAEAAA